ncbi:MAG: hypothetical protein ACRENO_06015 [Thermodesulfobacteriota bacterium]
MLTSKKYVFRTLILFLFCIFQINTASAKDIKDKVIKETNLESQIEIFCMEYCQGNERKGYLKSITLDQIDSNNYRVVARAALQSRQVVSSPLEFVMYDHTVIINTFGTLSADKCELLVDNVFIQNDLNNIFTSLLKSQTDIIGRKEIIPDCKRFIN